MSERVRELVLLAGVLASAGVFFWSMTLAKGPERGSAAPRSAAENVGEVTPSGSEAPAAAPGEPSAKRPGAKKPGERRSEGGKGGSSGAASSEAGRSGTGAEAASTSSISGSGAAPSGGSRSTGGGSEPIARLVEVKGTSATVSAEGMTFRFRADTHKPVAGEDFTLGIEVARARRAVNGSVTVDVVHQGEVVGHIHTGALRRGAYTHTWQWPERSAGHPLTLKVSAKAGGRIQTFLFEIQVKPAS